jgi:hypothetical protein
MGQEKKPAAAGAKRQVTAKSTPAGILLVALGLGTVGLVALLYLYGPRFQRAPSIGPDSHSRSAVGFAGLHELLRAAGPGAGRVTFSGQDPDLRGLYVDAGRNAVFLPDDDRPWRLFVGQGAMVVFLEKWGFGLDPENANWVADQVPLSPESGVLGLEGLLGPGFGPTIVSRPWPRGDDFAMAFEAPAPAGLDEIHLIREGSLEPVVWTGDGLLVGRRQLGSLAVYLVADPDVANNMGLGLGQNGAFVLGLFAHVMEREGLSGPIRFLETVGESVPSPRLFGPGTTPSPLINFPPAVVTILALASGLMALAALGGRFGGPGAGTGETVFGKSKLIANSARLMARAGLLPSVVEGYLAMSLRRAAKAIHAPPQAGDLPYWLDRAARSKGIGLSAGAILERASLAKGRPDELMGCALDMHEFRKELESGPSRPGHSGQ